MSFLFPLNYSLNYVAAIKQYSGGRKKFNEILLQLE